MRWKSRIDGSTNRTCHLNAHVAHHRGAFLPGADIWTSHVPFHHEHDFAFPRNLYPASIHKLLWIRALIHVFLRGATVTCCSLSSPPRSGERCKGKRRSLCGLSRQRSSMGSPQSFNSLQKTGLTPTMGAAPSLTTSEKGLSASKVSPHQRTPDILLTERSCAPFCANDLLVP